MTGVAIVVVFLFVVGVVHAVVIVPRDSVYVIERMGRYRTTLPVGFNLIMPIADRIAFKHTLALQTRESTEVYETKDQRRASLTSAFRFRVIDAQRASYGAADYLASLLAIVRVSQKRFIEGEVWDSLRENTRSLENEILRNAEAPAEAFGVKVLEYEVRDLHLEDEAGPASKST